MLLSLCTFNKKGTTGLTSHVLRGHKFQRLLSIYQTDLVILAVCQGSLLRGIDQRHQSVEVHFQFLCQLLNVFFLKDLNQIIVGT